MFLTKGRRFSNTLKSITYLQMDVPFLRWSGGTFAICDHPLSNINQFHHDLRGFPRFRVYLGTSNAFLCRIFIPTIDS